MKTSKKEKNQEQSMYSVLCSTHLCSHYWITRQAFGQDKIKQNKKKEEKNMTNENGNFSVNIKKHE